MWSDSQVALSWTKTDPSLLKMFVANRVAKIQSLVDINTWQYINTNHNPADLASRGLDADKLVKAKIWWMGPEFLKYSNSEWPVENFNIPRHELPEIKRKSLIFKSANYDSIFSQFSSLVKLKRVVALCIRFFNNLKNKRHNKCKTGILTIEELDYANIMLIKLAQSKSFDSELKILAKHKNLDTKPRLLSLSPFMDERGILRVGGRLRTTYLPYNFKHPILISSEHPLTKLIFEHKHQYLLHPGPQLLLASVRQFYYPIGGRNLAKKTVKKCITCFKFNPTPAVYPMGGLPNNRIKTSFPFETTGIDYAGPFFILNKPVRGAKLDKSYLALFVCFCTKAVHLEIVNDLTSESFLACLKRFIARRGLPATIYLDNGSTFRGANNELRDLGMFLHKNQNFIVNSTSNDNIKWVFIPPYSPNFGGLWESAVKSAKHHLKRTLVNRNVTFEELNTLVIQVEGILNSRPLFSLSDNPNDLLPITPSHFLIGRPIYYPPEPDLLNEKSSHLT
ncbi:uncharacterized protein LOC126738055 [Anthonomus grandis grandis]|uniref:uncharacterized protein LOC126738055 n=1 Tax=Anthonomus grandis grandis TaxID=2921223 RepID=UPI0021659F60|nr:uncharacterized protein LOC126738055 [Anthonomus grandis grandis]